jgi:hypothetical protein
MSLHDFVTDENKDKDKDKELPEGFKGVGDDEPKEKKPFRYKKGTEIAKKPNTIYLDLDVMEALDNNVSKREKSNFINDLLVKHFELQDRIKGTIIED